MAIHLTVAMVVYLVLWTEPSRGLEMALNWVDRLVLSMAGYLAPMTGAWMADEKVPNSVPRLAVPVPVMMTGL